MDATPYPQGAFTATPAERRRMHEADAAMRRRNLARHVIDAFPETEAGRQERRAFLQKLIDKHGTEAAGLIEREAREYWQQTRKSRAPAKEAR